MKKLILILLCIIFGVILGIVSVFLALKVDQDNKIEEVLNQNMVVNTAVDAQSNTYDIVSISMNIAQIIKDRDYTALAAYIHPERGVLFTPYSTVDFSSNKCFFPDEVKQFDENKTSYVWGVMDGSGNPIEMTVDSYFDRFVFDYDYTQAQAIGVNYIIRSGNSLENVDSMFHNARFVDLNNPGSKERDYLDWSTLRLVFEEYNGQLMLTAIIHCEWTV